MSRDEQRWEQHMAFKAALGEPIPVGCDWPRCARDGGCTPDERACEPDDESGEVT